MASTSTQVQPTRVRQALSLLNSVEKAQLKKLLPKPKELNVPTATVAESRYPAALLSALAACVPGEQYSLLGLIAEDLVGQTPAEITLSRLLDCVAERLKDCDVSAVIQSQLVQKVSKSATTERFLEQCRATATAIVAAAATPLRHEATLTSPDGVLEGHPDYSNDTQVFEVKLTGQLKQNLGDFLLQLFAYAALAPPTVTDVYLVLPLQQTVWHYCVTGWKGRTAFRDFLSNAISTKSSTMPAALELLMTCHIGAHIAKGKTLLITVSNLPDAPVPSQIFLGGPQSSSMKLDDADIAAAAAVVAVRGLTLFVHSQYIINLCVPPTAENEAYGSRLLIRNLQIAAALGARGVVVHVGKSTTQELSAALATMRANLLEALEYATPECPILLETPAGQGSEVLTTQADFKEFVESFHTPRFRTCVDTCHVWATGHEPLTYLRDCSSGSGSGSSVALVHFNDSATPCGSCLDRHAFVGQGHIGIARLTDVAHHCVSSGILMVVE